MIRGSTLLLLGRVISKLANFATQVLIVRYLSHGAFGGFAYALSIVALAQGFLSLGLDRSIARFLPMFHERRDAHRLIGTIIMTLAVLLSLSLVVIVALYGLRATIGVWVGDKQALALLLVLIFLAPVQALDDLLISMFAVFAKSRSIFVRRHIVAPALKLAVVIALILTRSDVMFLAVGYVTVSLIGVGIYGYLFLHVLRQQGLLENSPLRGLVMPWREVLGFSIPLLTTDLVYLSMTAVNVVILQYFWGATGVADFRAVQPAAKLCELVMVSFATLFTPVAARMFANKDHAGINQLYWQTAVWIAILSFPIFAVTFSLAHPITILLFGTRYGHAAPILALLSLGYYFNAALGFNGLTLRVYGKIRYIVMVNGITAVLNTLLGVLLIPRLGALGAGVATMVGLVVHNVLKQAGLRLGTGIGLFDWRYLRVYVMIVLLTLGLFVFQLATSFSVYVNLGLAVVAAFVVLRVNGGLLQVDQLFPEVMRFPGMRLLVTGRK